MAGLAKFLSAIKEDKDSMKSTMVNKDNLSTWFLIPRSRLKIRFKDLSVRTQDVSGDVLIWGHPTYGLWGTSKWGTAFPGTVSNVESSAVSNTLTDLSLKEISYFLGGVSTARSPKMMIVSTGTTGYNVSSTAMPGTNIGTTNISSDTFRRLSGTFYNMNNSTGAVNSIGIFSQDGSVLYNYKNLLSGLEFDINTNYYFDIDYSVENAGGNRSIWTNVGTTYIAEWLGGTSKSIPSHIGFGNGTSSISETDYELEGELQRNEIDGSDSNNFETIIYGSLTKNQGTGNTITKNAIFTGGTADANAEMIIENKNFDVLKTSLFRVDVIHKNVLN